MVVTDHDLPLLAAARDTMSDDFASVFEPHSRAGATKHIGPGIDRIGQQPVNRMVARRPPLHDPALGTIDGNRQVNPLLPQPHGELAHAADFAELAEHQRHHLANPPVRILLQATVSAAPGVPIAPVAGQPRRLDRQHCTGRAGADRHEQTLEAGTRLTITRPAEIIVDNNDVLPAECARPCRQAVLSTAALGVVEQLIRLRLPDIDISVAREVLRRNLIHCWPRPAAVPQGRGVPPSAVLAETSPPTESVEVSGWARARRPRARVDRAAGGRLVAPSSHVPFSMFEDDKDRSAPSIALRSAYSASSVRRGVSVIVTCAAQGSVIQAGNSARMPSGCSITKWTLPP